MAHVFTQRGWLTAIEERVRFARARFGLYDTIDFVVVLLGYAISGERTLKAFYERLTPFGKAFMGLFGRGDLPSRSALSQYLAALDQQAVEALRTLFQEDLGACKALGQGGLSDREGRRWVIIDVDATREASRQRALPHGPDLPSPHRRMDAVCAPGYTGRKRGEVVRSRTTVLQAHMQSWLGTFGGAGNGDYRGELLRAIETIRSLAQIWSIPLSRILIRLDGLYGDAAPLLDLLTSGLGVVVRGREYGLLDLPSVQARLCLPPDAWTRHPESGVHRALFDCPGIQLVPFGPTIRMIVAVHPSTATPAPVGITKDGQVYEIFLTSAPQEAFSPADVLHLYLHRGAFETVLAHEDQEQDPDRWVSQTQWGQECWQILSQWVWNWRLELGRHLAPNPLRLTELVPQGAVTRPDNPPALVAMISHTPALSAPTPALFQGRSPAGYGPPVFSTRSGRCGYAGTAFVLQPDGTLRCPADKPLYPQKHTPQANGSLRIRYAARISHCQVCQERCACQGVGISPHSARTVSAVRRPLVVEGSARGIDTDAPAPSDLGEASNPSTVSGSTLPALGEADGLVPTSAPKKRTLPAGYAPPVFSDRSAQVGFPGTAFSLQPDGTLLCPARHLLTLLEERPLQSGPIRVVFAARLTDCRDCALRQQCQGPGNAPVRARRVHALCHPHTQDPSAFPLANVPTVLASPPVQVVPLQSQPLSPPALQTSLQPPPVQIAPQELLPPPALQTLPEPPPVQVALQEIEPVAPSAIQAPSSPLANALGETSPPPTPDGASPRSVLWEDWAASHIRQQWMERLRTETVHLTIGPPQEPSPAPSSEPTVLTRAERAHWRLSWRQRLARNARPSEAPLLSITLHGLPASFAETFALALAA